MTQIHLTLDDATLKELIWRNQKDATAELLNNDFNSVLQSHQ